MKRLSIFVDHRPQQHALQDLFVNRDLRGGSFRNFDKVFPTQLKST